MFIIENLKNEVDIENKMTKYLNPPSYINSMLITFPSSLLAVHFEKNEVELVHNVVLVSGVLPNNSDR